MFRKRVTKIRGISGSLDGHRVLVAGATTGAGPGIVRVAAAAGAVVYASGNDSPQLDIELSRLGSTPVAVTPIVADIATPAGRDRLLATVADPIDSLIVNVATGEGPGVIEPATSLMASVATQMQDRGYAGCIVAINGVAGHGAAGATAAFLQAEIEVLATQLAPNSIRVNAVAIGPVGATRRDNPRPSRVTPLGHVALHPVEVGKAVWFLINDDLSSGITGTTLKIDRGASLLRAEW